VARSIRILLVAALAVATVIGAATAEPTPIRIGWQPTTTVEAQIAHALSRTDILERNDLKGAFTMFSAGPAVNEALASGAIDVGFIGDMPSVTLAAAGAPITVVARQSVFRGAIVASGASGMTKLVDLRGRKLYGPVGTGIYLAAMSMLKDAGLTPGKDVEVLNMGFADLADALRSGKIEALFVWDPWVALFESRDLVKVLGADVSLTMVTTMRSDFLESKAAAAERFLRAQKEALVFAATHPELTNKWFAEPDAAKALPVDIVQRATAEDPQWRATALEDVRLNFTKTELDRYFGLAQQASDLKIFPKLPPLRERTNLSLAERVDAATWSFDPNAVRVK
jgi:sulfonate transport system substrate-binding protein